MDFKDKARSKLWTHPLKQWFSELAVCPQGHLAMSGDIFDCRDWDEGRYWHLVGASDAAKPHTKL